MSGMNAETGRLMDENAHIAQSLRDIFTTRIGSRVARRDYGSVIPELIDFPSSTTALQLQAAAIMAAARWEPRVTVRGAGFSVGMDGTALIDLTLVKNTGPRTNQALSVSVRL